MPGKRISVRMTHDRWQLAFEREDGSLDAVRDLRAGEYESICSAIGALRNRLEATAVRMLDDAGEELASSLDDFLMLAGESETPTHDFAHRIQRCLVSWLLLWRLHLWHCKADLTRKRDANSSALEAWEASRRRTYDDHLGYRIAEALRDYVQHRAMPPLHAGWSKKMQPDGTVERTAHVTIKVDALHGWARRKKPGLCQDLQPGTVLHMKDVLGDAQAGMDEVTVAYIDAHSDELVKALSTLVGVANETAPHTPVLLRVVTTEDGWHFPMTRLDDVHAWISRQRDRVGEDQ